MLRCPENKSDYKINFTIYAIPLPSMTVDLEVVCECDCEKPDQEVSPTSFFFCSLLDYGSLQRWMFPHRLALLRQYDNPNSSQGLSSNSLFLVKTDPHAPWWRGLIVFSDLSLSSQCRDMYLQVSNSAMAIDALVISTQFTAKNGRHFRPGFRLSGLLE